MSSEKQILENILKSSICMFAAVRRLLITEGAAAELFPFQFQASTLIKNLFVPICFYKWHLRALGWLQVCGYTGANIAAPQKTALAGKSQVYRVTFWIKSCCFLIAVQQRSSQQGCSSSEGNWGDSRRWRKETWNLAQGLGRVAGCGAYYGSLSYSSLFVTSAKPEGVIGP